jgi:ubiquinone/menaquinone biosynthesis C-methylase UbiE
VTQTPNRKFQLPNTCLLAGRSSSLQFQMTRQILFRIWVIGIYLRLGLPARSPASRSLAEGKRFGEGRCFGFGASVRQCSMRSALCHEYRRIDFFEKAAPYYDIILDLLTFRQYANFLRRAVGMLAPEKGERILDLCSGTGRVASWISHGVGKEGEVVGMDIAKLMVGVATNRNRGLGNVFFLQKDVTKSWEYQNYFSGVFTSFAIHELAESERLGVLEKSYLALKEKGRMVIADFNPRAWGRSKTISLTFFKLFERGNLNFFSFDQNEMLKKVGFKKIRAFPVLGGLFQITVAFKI